MLEMAADTDYTEFQNSVDLTITCAEGDTQDTPIFMYMKTEASYTHGGGTGSQSSKGDASVSFDEAMAATAYYIKTVTGGEPPLTVSGDHNFTNTQGPDGAPAPTNSGSPAPGPAPAPTPSKSGANFFGMVITSALLLGMTFIMF
jgi:hypothetical protein